MMIIITTIETNIKKLIQNFYKREETLDYDISFILFNNYLGETCS